MPYRRSRYDDCEKFVDTEFLDIGHDQRMLEDN